MLAYGSCLTVMAGNSALAPLAAQVVAALPLLLNQVPRLGAACLGKLVFLKTDLWAASDLSSTVGPGLLCPEQTV